LAKAAKKEVQIDTVDLPKYSMDLNPWDYSLFEDIEKRVAAKAPKGKETVAAFKKRLRLVALRTPQATVLNAFAGMKKRMRQIIKAKGGCIPRD